MTSARCVCDIAFVLKSWQPVVLDQTLYQHRMMLTTRSLLVFIILFTCRVDGSEEPQGPGGAVAEQPNDAIGSKSPASPSASEAEVGLESERQQNSQNLRSGWGYGRHPGSYTGRGGPNQPPARPPVAMGPRR